MKCTLQIGDEHVMWAEERESNWRCVWPKRVRKKLYSEQYKTAVDKQVARQQLGQHWFSSVYI
jgi:hypothetical protein